METTSGYYVCTNGHGKLMSKRAVEMLEAEQVEADLQAFLNSDEHLAAVYSARKKEEEREQKRIEVAKKREEHKKRLAELPAAFETKIRGIYKVEDHDGLFTVSTKRTKGSFQVLDIAGRRSAWVQQAREDVVDNELSKRAGGNLRPWRIESTPCLPTDRKKFTAYQEAKKFTAYQMWKKVEDNFFANIFTNSTPVTLASSSTSSQGTIAYENPPGW
jgi:hypothetical protein